MSSSSGNNEPQKLVFRPSKPIIVAPSPSRQSAQNTSKKAQPDEEQTEPAVSGNGSSGGINVTSPPPSTSKWIQDHIAEDLNTTTSNNLSKNNKHESNNKKESNSDVPLATAGGKRKHPDAPSESKTSSQQGNNNGAESGESKSPVRKVQIIPLNNPEVEARKEEVTGKPEEVKEVKVKPSPFANLTTTSSSTMNKSTSMRTFGSGLGALTGTSSTTFSSLLKQTTLSDTQASEEIGDAGEGIKGGKRKASIFATPSIMIPQQEETQKETNEEPPKESETISNTNNNTMNNSNSGEERDLTLFKGRVNLKVYDTTEREWKHRGSGPCHINLTPTLKPETETETKETETETKETETENNELDNNESEMKYNVRIVVRNVGTLAVIMNVNAFAEMDVRQSGDRTLIIATIDNTNNPNSNNNTNNSNNGRRVVTYAMRFDNKVQCEDARHALERHKCMSNSQLHQLYQSCYHHHHHP